jgi:hypothetical protein
MREILRLERFAHGDFSPAIRWYLQYLRIGSIDGEYEAVYG